MNRDNRNNKKKNRGSNLKSLLAVTMAVTLFGSLNAFADWVPDELIRANLCSESFCRSKFDDFAILVCNQRPAIEFPNESAVFSSYLEGSRPCLCPCNFSKFYNH